MNELTTLSDGLYTWSTHEANVYNLKGLYSGDLVKEKKKINENYEPGKSWKNNPREEKCQKANHNTLKSQELKF